MKISLVSFRVRGYNVQRTSKASVWPIAGDIKHDITDKEKTRPFEEIFTNVKDFDKQKKGIKPPISFCVLPVF